MIGICILIFFMGATVGMVLTVLATADSYDEAVSDAYDIGYEKGKEEGKESVTKEQAEIMRRYGLVPENWIVFSETSKKLVILSKRTRLRRVLLK